MIGARDLVCLSSQDWTDVWTRKQRFMRRLAQAGRRVLYVNAPASWASAGRLASDWRRPFRWMERPVEIEPNLFIGTLPLAIPGFQMSLAINAINTVVTRAALRRWLRQLAFDAPVLWTYNPHTADLAGTLGESCVVYECVDELTASRGLVRADVVRELEGRLVERADMVIVTHPNLYESKRAQARNIRLIPNGAEVDHFARASDPSLAPSAEMRPFPKPIIGVVGTLQYWIDFELLRFLAERRPEWTFVLIGPVGRRRLARIDRVAGLPNVHVLGRRPYADLPSYMRAFDVCLNPYVLDETARNCSPLKLYEYLASGKPVVSVDMSEARQFAPLVGIGRTYDEVLARIEESLRPEASSAAAVRARMDAAAPHSWDRRFEAMDAALDDAVRARPGQTSVSSSSNVFSAAARHE